MEKTDNQLSAPAGLGRSRLLLTLQEDANELRRAWLAFVVLGVLLILVGTAALGSALIATLATVSVFGWLLVVGGAFQAGGSIWCRSWGGFFLHLLAGILYLVVGFLVVNHPGEAAIVYTLLIAVLLFVQGLFRILGAVAGQFHNWGWVFLSGCITLALGAMIWRQWPLSGLWVIGLFVGIEMLFSGWALLMLGLAARRLPQEPTA
jgi:uncharacterized membrane protein HdeD (DUF308 family)